MADKIHWEIEAMATISCLERIPPVDHDFVAVGSTGAVCNKCQLYVVPPGTKHSLNWGFKYYPRLIIPE